MLVLLVGGGIEMEEMKAFVGHKAMTNLLARIILGKGSIREVLS